MIRPTLPRDERGGISVLLAGSLFAMTGAATVAVDLGSIYLAKRELQGVADAAALAATDGGRTAAQAVIGKSGVDNVTLTTALSGTYTASTDIPVDQRFQPGGSAGTAMQVEVTRRVPLFFGRLLVGRDGIDLTATATAARSDAAAFSLGTGLASLSGGVPNMILSSLAGTELNLSVMDYNGLVNANVHLLGVADALRIRLGRDGESYGTLFDRTIAINDLLMAMAETIPGTPAAVTLHTLAGRLPGKSVKLSDIIDLGPSYNASTQTGQPDVILDSFSMVRMLLSPPSGTSVPVDLSVAVPGLTNTRLMVVTGPGQAHTPLLTVTASRDVVLRTAQTRIYVESSVATSLSGLLTVRVPVYVELAAAEARLSDIRCGDQGGVTLAVTPSIGTAVLGDVDVDALTDFSIAPNSRTALLAQTIGTRVTAFTNMSLGGVQAQSVFFSPGDIATQAVKTVSTNDLVQGIAASLAQRTNVQVSVLGINVSTSPLTSQVGALLGTTAPLIDGLINNVTATLGVRLGTADVRVHQRRCGMATIVA